MLSHEMKIRIDDLSGQAIADFLAAHLDAMAELSPPQSRHALDLAGLRVPEVTFWSVWDGESLMGCGALKELDGEHGEIKSMRTAPDHRRRGVGAAMLDHILVEARARRYRRLSLETGSMDAFRPAHALYRRFGFRFCAPFGDYVEDSNSVFMTREL